ncbi:MAG: STAS/SEC14 domain-containing protein [Chthoniobacterales bacterium]
MHKITPEKGNVVRVQVSGKLTQEDYDQLIPSWKETIARHGSMRLLLIMEDFEGWKLGAAWDDFRFSTGHAKRIVRVAMVGEKTWQKWMAKLGALFLADEIKYFELSQLVEAERWVHA